MGFLLLQRVLQATCATVVQCELCSAESRLVLGGGHLQFSLEEWC